MSDWNSERARREITEVGETEIRRRIIAGATYSPYKSAFLKAELEALDRARNEASQSEQNDIARSAAKAARDAADAAREANQHAKSANRISILAIVIAIATAIASGVLWWMDHGADGQ